jgi:predicted nucleic acid-binding protein
VKPCFADTFFFLALLTRGSAAHGRAVELNRADRPIVTTWFVMLELADHLCDSRNRHLFPKVLDAISSDNRFDLVQMDADTLNKAANLYRNRTDKEWSLTDCTSFETMKARHISEALTGDRHFEQAGFVPLLIT